MDFIPGTPLSRLKEEMESRGLRNDGPESQLLGRKMLRSLTEAYGRMIFGSGFIHGASDHSFFMQKQRFFS